MTDVEKRIKALEKRVAALESKEQAPLGYVKVDKDNFADIVIKTINQRTREAGKQVLLM